jgi:uncharacterized protein
MHRVLMLSVLLFVPLLHLAGAQALAAESTKKAAVQSDTTKKIVLQISDFSPEKQTLVLNVANNLLKAYPAGGVKLEIVAFGPGMMLLFEDNTNKDRVQSLAASDVRFSSCQNTVKGMTEALGYPPKISKHAVPVEAGVTRIVDLTGQGYTLVRP